MVELNFETSKDQEFNKKLKKYRLSLNEYQKICELLQREPNAIEWALFSALWSEHCSYKSSKIHLKKFYNKNSKVIVSEGENSGVIDIGMGEKISFKMESHNHPSFIEPVQGAATGVGGILRDIFTMGARPVALANYLCFGESDAPRMKNLISGVVKGISSYGNCVGVPNLTGFTEFHSSYNKNILVNAFALGLFEPEDPIALSYTKSPGADVVYVGSQTGRDGIHGASMASESFNNSSASQRPTVQIGDPFFEKCLIESCIEAISSGKVLAIQDMGAAGLISSSFEMSAKSGHGFELNLDEIPLRDSTLTPEEILLSESQERMLLVCHPEDFDNLKNIFNKWGLQAARVGKVREEPEVRLLWKNELLTEIHPSLLVDKAPQYQRPFDSYKISERKEIELEIFDISESLQDCIESEFGSSKEWIFKQYDQRVGGQTAMDCSHSVGIIGLEKSKRALSIALGCRPYLMRADVRVGAMDSVLHPALQLAIKGFKPLALTDCLNFGNPENPKIMGEFVESVESISSVCKVLDVPVISGNVSFYNETLKQNITSTPATAIVGLRESIQNIPADCFQKEHSFVYLVYDHQVTTGGAFQELYKRKVNIESGEFELESISHFIQSLQKISQGVLSSKVVGKFGLLYSATLMSSETLELHMTEKVPFLKTNLDLFKERLYEVLVEVTHPGQFEAYLNKCNISFARLGRTQKISKSTQDLKSKYKNYFESKIS